MSVQLPPPQSYLTPEQIEHSVKAMRRSFRQQVTKLHTRRLEGKSTAKLNANIARTKALLRRYGLEEVDGVPLQ